jgi:hypothetical protein
VSEDYANIRSYQLKGRGNRAVGNLGSESDAMFMNDAGYESIADSGGNVHGVDPGFESSGCNGLKPTNSKAKAYGHTAIGSATSFTSGDSGIGGIGIFSDDEGIVFEKDIERLAAAGITRGCGAGRFCPGDHVTRGQMAAFLVRSLGLEDSDGDRFRDDNQSIFREDIDTVAEAGITAGCNPPDNDRFCPDRPVTRAQMASFLTRAKHLSGGSAGFEDISGSIHADDIEALAAGGITKGCNPPDNDRFCPDRPVTRGEMAAFLVRSFDP